MITFGQRLKILRKEACLTQGDLAEQLMVAVQTVSKWECDTSMPDISQLVPLSAILGVTTDCLLGVGGNEKEDREKLWKELENIDKYCLCLTYEDNAAYKSYEVWRDYSKKYPLDYYAKYRCADEIMYFIESSERYKFFIPDDEKTALYEEGLKYLKTLISQDKDPSNQIAAKERLIDYYLYVQDFSKAEAVAEELPDIYTLKLDAIMKICDKKKEYDKCIEISKDISYYSIYCFLDSMYTRGRRISILGNVEKENAIKAWREYEYIAREIYKIFPHPNTKWYVLRAIWCISNDCIAISDFDGALTAIESMRDFGVECYNELKAAGESKEVLEDHKALIQNSLKRGYFLSLGDPDNIIDNDPRFRKCQEDIEALN